MKKLLLAVVLPLAATSVYAETSVMLYGGADGGITVQKLKGNLQRLGLPNGSLDTNMFGFTGTEDLGNVRTGVNTECNSADHDIVQVYGCKNNGIEKQNLNHGRRSADNRQIDACHNVQKF